ncbi:hypothetical protein OG206_02365 [Streptomyces sp. NBC_01341]|uniref:hypothetical protein n=1 Tax=Streptomyces sp. NBC_01341 TaxID=2903831 RepID=UPI002E1377B3|nr:hypothetical protein OG206_02365 [Streptomyces sp. NBC_01341]
MTTPKQLLVRTAARNNAEWCAAMSRSHGVESEFGAQVWRAPTRTPLFYPDAVTLTPGTAPATVTDGVDAMTPGASVKDSFSDVDLSAVGYRILFEAQWIHRPAGVPAARYSHAWEVADSPAALRAWADAWDEGDGHADLFRSELLDDPATFVLAGRSPEGRITAGAVASLSEKAVGISNVFASEGGPDAAWPFVLTAVHSLFPALPLVGYEHGDALAAAVRHGFEPIGPLRIWLRGEETPPVGEAGTGTTG